MLFFGSYPNVSLPIGLLWYHTFPLDLAKARKWNASSLISLGTRDKFYLCSSTGQRSALVKFLYPRTTFLLTRKWYKPPLLILLKSSTYCRNSHPDSSCSKDNWEFLNLKFRCSCPALKANWMPKNPNPFSLPKKNIFHEKFSCASVVNLAWFTIPPTAWTAFCFTENSMQNLNF